MAKERVICAAVKASDGTVFYGHRHGDCLRAMVNHGRTIASSEDAQGFVTTRGRYVSRMQGRMIQEKAGIQSADADGYRGSTLFSEDLYAAGCTRAIHSEPQSGLGAKIAGIRFIE